MLESFELIIDIDALEDIQNAVDYYNSCQPDLGKRFFEIFDNQIKFLQNHYYSFAIRYDDVRFMPVDKFPYIIHYQVVESLKTINIKAIFCSYENPEKWKRNSD